MTLSEIARRLLASQSLLDRWFAERQAAAPPLVTVSVDIRNAGFKASVIDTNLYPAGFNNLCETFSENAARAFRRYFEHFFPGVRKIHLYPEAHTRNLFYQENVSALIRILKDAGYVASVGPRILDADLILLNNDLSSGIPDDLRVHSLPIIPPLELGWHSRKKSRHFQIFGDLIREVASLIQLDPWVLFPLTTLETAIDLESDACLQRLQRSADELLGKIADKYREYGIAQEPYLFVKNNAGTYGLGLLPIDSGRELLYLSRRLRNKLSYAKGGKPVTELLLQEGIQTTDTWQGKPLEPVVYLVGGEPVGTFFRIHDEKTQRESLNAPGMRFSCVCYHQVDKAELLTLAKKEELFRVSEFLSKIGSLAASCEVTPPSTLTPVDSGNKDIYNLQQYNKIV